MLLNLINIIKDILLTVGSYSNTSFLSPLSPEDEKNAIDAMFQGDKDARNTLIERNLRLVAHIVKKYTNDDDIQDDLISIGTIGLIKAIDSYNLSKDTKITTYAARCIENEILMYFRSNKKNNNVVSLNDAIGFDKDGNEVNLIDIMPDKNRDIIEILHEKDNIKDLKKYLVDLSFREKQIIIKRYGLFNQREQTQKSIAKELGISRSYVSRIEKRALTKILRSFLNNKSVL